MEKKTAPVEKKEEAKKDPKASFDPTKSNQAKVMKGKRKASEKKEESDDQQTEEQKAE